MISLAITPEEKAAGHLTPEHIQTALAALRDDGFVVLENVVSSESLDALREKMLADVEAFTNRPDAPFNFNRGNVQQDPPPFPPYLFRDVLVNDFVIDVTRAALGPGVTNAFYSGNTAIKSEEEQPVHADTGQLFPGLEVATPAFGLVVNVPVVDMSAENGSTGIWPGTHKDTTVAIADGDIKATPEALARWREKTTPIQPDVKRGSILIRDIRLWHNGMPNRTDTPRPMIAMIHWVGWWKYIDKLTFPKGTEEFFQHPELRTNAVFVDGPIDYIRKPQAYEYSEK